MNDVLQFIEAFLEAEYRAVVAQYTERDQARCDEQIAKLAAFAVPDVEVVIGHRPRHPDEKFFAIGDEKHVKGEFDKRTLFQVKLYEHATLGHLYRVYVGPDEVFPQAPTYAENLFISAIGGDLKIVSVYGFNRRFPQRKGYRYFTDHGLAWNHSSGAEITALGTPVAVRKFQAPRDVSGALSEYQADRELEPGTLPEGLDTFIERLKQGDVEFYTRFQEDVWGCRYLGEGRFEYWHQNYQMADMDGREELDEAGVIKLFAQYPVERLQNGLIARRTETARP
ncbi:MAG: hypothetical protein RBT80_18830 [Candidatus Vecturithrix sp.]|jgi:hypothetical protein|nr:hypothetical protein [Candidatus Vecturithrix sp.]